MKRDLEPNEHSHLFPQEVIETSEGPVVALRVLSTSQEMQDATREYLESLGNTVMEAGDPRLPKSTSTLRINYDHPKASSYFRNKRWQPDEKKTVVQPPEDPDSTVLN